MSRVMYNGKRLIPAPFVSISKEYQRTEDGTPIGASWNINISGTVVAFKGSPSSDGTFWTLGGFPADETFEEDSKLGSILRKQEAIRQLFAEDGHQLEFQSEDGTAPMKCNPKILNITFQEGLWFDRLQYTISCQADILYINGTEVGEDDFTDYIESAADGWQIETSDEPQSDSVFKTYRITHTVSAKGKTVYNDTGTLIKPAWQQAKSWVTAKLGLSNSIVSNSSITGLPTTGYNHIRSESIDEYSGQYSITESWALSNDNYIETYEVTTSTSLDNGLTSSTINGTITGLLNNSSKYTNAQARWETVQGLLLSRCQTYGGTTFNVLPVSTSVGKNPATGVITYTYTFDTRPSTLIDNAKSETITIQDNLQTEFPVPIFVLGRTLGPVIQDLATSKERTRQLSIEASMPTPSGSISERLSQAPDVESIVSGIAPIGQIVKIADSSKNWDIISGRFTRTVTWMWEP